MTKVIADAALEVWFRTRYFDCKYDISSSGVADCTLGELRARTGVSLAELDELVFRDSPSTGAARLREAIAARYAPGRADSVMVTHGSSEAIYLAMAAVVRPGDEVVVMSPVYHSLAAIAESLGARLRVWSLSAADGFRPDLERLRAQLSPRTRAVVVNFPHNPTGVTLTPAQYAEFLELLAPFDAYLFWDGAFTDLHFDAERLPEPTESREKCLSFGTLSKAYGLPGLRIGWCIGPSDVRRVMVKLRDYTSLSCSPLAEQLAAAAIDRADLFIGPRLERARTNRSLFTQWLARNQDLVDWAEPTAAVTVFPRFRTLADTTPVCESLAAHDSVLTVPGACFGYPQHMRIGLGGATEGVQIGLECLARGLRQATAEPC